MSKLKGAINQAKREVFTARLAIGALFIICLALSVVIYTLPRSFTIYNPPDLRLGSQRSIWDVPPSTVYAFAYQTFQQLNR